MFVPVLVDVHFCAEDATGFVDRAGLRWGLAASVLQRGARGVRCCVFFNACVIFEYPSVRWGYVWLFYADIMLIVNSECCGSASARI